METVTPPVSSSPTTATVTATPPATVRPTPTAADRTAAAGYAFGRSARHAGEQDRCLSDAYDALTIDRLAATGVGPGWRCLDAGAGGGGIARWLARWTAPGGSVLATERDPARLAPGPGLAVLRHDLAHDPLPDAEFDLAHARLVLTHVPDRPAVLRRLLAALRPGGRLQVADFDAEHTPVLLAPDPAARAAWTAFVAAKLAVLRAAGADPSCGRHLAAELCAAGFTDVTVTPHVELLRAASPALRLQFNHTHHLEAELLAQGLTEHQLYRVRDAMCDERFAALSGVLYTVQGRRPR